MPQLTEAPFISIRNVSRRFGDVVAVDNLSLDIERGELFCLLGASGCGKTTLLRMLAGFERVDEGVIEIDGIDMSHVPPAARPVNIMFQNYALFPHMTVANNIAYGLRRAALPRWVPRLGAYAGARARLAGGAAVSLPVVFAPRPRSAGPVRDPGRRGRRRVLRSVLPGH